MRESTPVTVFPYIRHRLSVRNAKETIAEYTRRLARALHVVGMINIQFIVMRRGCICNRGKSTFQPYRAVYQQGNRNPDRAAGNKGDPWAISIKDLGYEPGLQKEADYIAIKMPVFSFEKIRGADISLGPEMKSTGECLGIAKTFNEALYKAFLGAGINLPKHKNMIITVKDEDKQDIIPIAQRFQETRLPHLCDPGHSQRYCRKTA